nr:hypothetical protein [Tanacetum cinerariifolium]
ATTKVNKDIDQEQIQALVDKTKVIITEDSIRSDLLLDDAEGTACLFNEALGAHGKPRRKQRKEAETSNDESKDEDHVPTPSSDPLPSGEDSSILNKLMVFYTNLQEKVLDLQEAKAAQAKEIVALKKKVSKLYKCRKSISGGLKRLKKIGSGRRVKSPMEKGGLGAQEDASKQERMIDEIDQNAEIALDDETQGRTNNYEMFGVDDLAEEKVVMDSVAEPVTTVKDSVALTTDVTEDEITMTQALAALKSVKPKVVAQEQEMSTTIPAAATKVTTDVLTPRAKEYARKLEAEEQEAARLSRAQQDEEANNSWDNIQAMMDDDRLLAEKLQARERDEFSKVDENAEPVIDDSKELRKCIEIVPDDGDEVLIEATPISSRSPISLTIKFTKKERITISRSLELMSTIYYLLVEKVYPLTRNTLHQLWSDVRLHVDYDVKMAYDLLRFIRKQLMEGYTPQ